MGIKQFNVTLQLPDIRWYFELVSFFYVLFPKELLNEDLFKCSTLIRSIIVLMITN